MKYLSVCSGIEAATVAWKPLGWEAVGFSEIEKFPSQLLKHHYPTVHNFGDFTKITREVLDERKIGAVDLIVGGTPCQDYSVSGKRAGMDGSRGQLSFEFIKLAERIRPRWLLWENVPGVLSSNGGRDFSCFLKDLADIGYGFAYRVFDVQYTRISDGFPRAIPQRRRRVFLVGYFGDWRPPVAVLFDKESMSRHSKPSRTKKEKVARDAFEVSPFRMQAFGVNEEGETRALKKCIDKKEQDVAVAFQQNSRDEVRYMNGDGMIAGTLSAGQGSHHQNFLAFQRSAIRLDAKMDNMEVAPTLKAECKGGDTELNICAESECVPINTMVVQGRPSDNGRMGMGVGKDGDPCNTITTMHSHAVSYNYIVRRLTPIECERLMGFPDGYTDIRTNGKDTPDGVRYKALGNSFGVNVVRWIGYRISLVNGLINKV